MQEPTDEMTQYLHDELVRQIKREKLILTDDEFNEAFRLVRHRFIMEKRRLSEGGGSTI